MSNPNYMQLAGALGLLKLNDVDLDWTSLEVQMRDLGRRLGVAEYGDPSTGTPPTGFTDPVHAEIDAMHRTYRDMCLKLGLIRIGELFDAHDCIPLT